MQSVTHENWMKLALDRAKSAADQGEVPVGALIVFDDRIIGEGFNTRESLRDPLGHAEIIAIRQASQQLDRWRLTDCTLYVTLEPCLMCSGAIINSRIDRVVFGAYDLKAGAVTSLYQSLSDPRLNHRPEIISGVMAQECGHVLTEFFRRQRKS